jgi:hypothetical protein
VRKELELGMHLERPRLESEHRWEWRVPKSFLNLSSHPETEEMRIGRTYYIDISFGGRKAESVVLWCKILEVLLLVIISTRVRTTGMT